MTFHQVLERVPRPPKVSRERVDGRRLIKVQVGFDGEDGKPVFLTNWFDPAVNYLIRQSEVSRGGDWRSVSRVGGLCRTSAVGLCPDGLRGRNRDEESKAARLEDSTHGTQRQPAAAGPTLSIACDPFGHGRV